MERNGKLWRLCLLQDLSKLDQWKQGKLKNEEEKGRLEEMYHVKKKGIGTTIKELKQRVKAKATKIRKYEERNNQYKQNRLFQSN